MKGKFWSGVIVVLALMVAVASCAPAAAPTPVPTKAAEPTKPTAPKPAEGEPIKVGFAAPLTGAETYLYTNECKVLQMAAKEINAEGGVLGRPIEVVCMDDAGDPKQAVVVAQGFVDDSGIVAVYGHGYSGCTLPALPLYQEARLPVVGHPSNPRLTTGEFDVFFQNGLNDSVNGFLPAQIMQEDLGVKKVAVIHNKTMWGEGIAEVFRDTANEIGLEITSYQGVEGTTMDYSPVLTKIKAEQPDALYVGAYGVEPARVRKQMLELGMDDILFFGAELISTEYQQAVGDAGIGTYTIVNVPTPDYSPEVIALNERTMEDFGQQVEAWAYHAYEGLYIIADAIERAGVAERAAIRDALVDTDLPGLVEPWNFAFDEYGRMKEACTFLYQFVGPPLEMEIQDMWCGSYPD